MCVCEASAYSISLATNLTRARRYPLNINPKPESISGPAGSGRVADLYVQVIYHVGKQEPQWLPQLQQFLFLLSILCVGFLECDSFVVLSSWEEIGAFANVLCNIPKVKFTTLHGNTANIGANIQF